MQQPDSTVSPYADATPVELKKYASQETKLDAAKMQLKTGLDKIIWHIGEFMAKIGKLCYGNPNRQAFCDGFVLPGTSGPWHCYCCQTLQAKVQGFEFGDKQPLNYSRIKCVVIGDQFGRKWQWPAVKIVYFPSKVYRG